MCINAQVSAIIHQISYNRGMLTAPLSGKLLSKLTAGMSLTNIKPLHFLRLTKHSSELDLPLNNQFKSSVFRCRQNDGSQKFTAAFF